MSVEHKDLFYGRKSLSLDVNLETGSASIRFGTRTPSWLYWRRVHETTKLFKKADQRLRDLVDKWGTPITLRFDTADAKMKLWAESRKEELGFDSIETGGGGYRITVTKNYPGYTGREPSGPLPFSA